MPQKPSSDNSKKSKRTNERRSYIDTFRWGFVSEESRRDRLPSETSPPQQSKDSAPSKKKPTAGGTGDVRVESHDSKPPKRKGQGKKGSKSTGDKSTGSKSTDAEIVKGTQVAVTPSTTVQSSVKPKKTTHAEKIDGKLHSSKQSAPGHSPKNAKRKKAIVPPYIPADFDENDEDLRLPSYGRTPVPADNEITFPKQKITQQKSPEKLDTKRPEKKKAPLSLNANLSDEEGDVVSEGFRPCREQMVWDPAKSEYVPLVIPPKKTGEKPAKETPAALGEQQSKNWREKPAKKQLSERKSTKAKQDSTRIQEPIPSSQRTTSTQNKAKRHEQSPRQDNTRHRESRWGKTRREQRQKIVDTFQPDPADIESEVSGFAELGVSDVMLEALKMVRYLAPTPIQSGVFKKVQEGVDVMGQARTGTGKTAAFSMPIIEGVETCPPGNDPVALILVPTRELAVQVRDEAIRLSYGRDIHITACYGGKPIGKQIERLKSGIDILVGTPGRILDLMNRRALFLDSIRWVVLDEADRMLDIGFRPDIEKILKRTPQDRQTLLFSATLPQPVIRLAEKYMKSPEVLDFSNKSVAVETIEQFYVTVDPERKFDALVYLLEEQQPKQAIIFTRTKRGADRLARLLSNKFDDLAAIHGDLQQHERDRVMAKVRAGTLRYLVATDVVGRGIDVSTVSHIINYDIPKFCDDYVHRVGRTGRMGREGVAYTFVTVQEGSELTRIEMRIDKLLKRAELKSFESFTKPHDPDASLEEEPVEPPKPVFGKPVRKVRRAL